MLPNTIIYGSRSFQTLTSTNQTYEVVIDVTLSPTTKHMELQTSY